MSSLKTWLILLLLLPVRGLAAEDWLVSAFASCAGRYSAEMEHAWLVNVAEADRMAARRAQFIDLLAATAEPERLGQTLHLRIDAKVAHRQLLTAAVFSEDSDRANWAMHRARAEIAQCRRFLLES